MSHESIDRLYEGELTVAEFVWSFARDKWFDENQRDPLPETFEPPEYATKYLADDKRTMLELSAMSLDEAERRLRDEYEKSCAHLRAFYAEEVKRHARFKAVRDGIEAWPPATDELKRLKAWILEELGPEGDPPAFVDPGPPPDPFAWLRERQQSVALLVGEREKHLEQMRRVADLKTRFFAGVREAFGEDPVTASAKAKEAGHGDR